MKEQQPISKKEKKKQQMSFKDQHPQFFEIPQGKKATFKAILSDAVTNNQKNIQDAVKYVKANSDDHLKEFLKYKQSGLKRLVQSAAFQKTLSDLVRNRGISRQQAVLSLLYDDFLGDLWKRGKDAVATFWQKNKDSVFDMMKGAVVSILPKLLAIGGSRLLSQDPYAIDLQYIRTTFDELEMSCCPRQTLDPLALMRNRVEIPITTGTNGIATVLINPYAAVFGNGGVGVVGQAYYPFCAMSSSNTSLVYNGATVYAGSFNAQLNNMTGFLPDQCKVSFISTQSALNAQGKITAGLYYDGPNLSLEFGQANTFDGTVAALTSSQVLNSSYSARVFNIPQCLMKVQHIVRWIPTSNDFQSDLLNGAGGQGNTSSTTFAIMAIVFTGCTPSTTIGNLYLSSAISFKPIASQTGVFDVSVRGAYQGTHRWFHQLRKCNVPVQFISWNEAKQYVVQNFAQIPIGAQNSGFCIDKALVKLGLEPFGRPWITVKQLQFKYPGLAHYTYGHTSKPGLIVDLMTKHAYVNPVNQWQGDSNYVIGSTLYGRSFYTDFQSVFYESPYQSVPFESVTADINGSFVGDEVICGVHNQMQPVPSFVDSFFISYANTKPKMTFNGTQLVADAKGIWIYKGPQAQGLYPSVTYQMAAPYLQGNLYCPNQLSRIQIQKQLLKDGIQPNPGPRTLIKVPESTKRPAWISNPTPPLCPDCCLRQAILIRASSKGSDLDGMKDMCDDHWSESSKDSA